MAVASNAPFSEWKRTFTDPRLCAAIVDRLTYNAHIIETGTQSFRLAQSRNVRCGKRIMIGDVEIWPGAQALRSLRDDYGPERFPRA